MSSLRFSRRDIIVLISIFWSLVLIYCGYLLVLKVQDMRREAIIEANRTRNDIVIDNARIIERAIYKYQEKHTGNLPVSLEQLVESKCLKTIPVNPFTSDPMRIIRMGESNCEGEISLLFGNYYIGNRETKTVEQRAAVLIVEYGNCAEGFSKHEYGYRFHYTEIDLWSAELADKVIMLTGRLCASSVKMGGPHYWYRDSDEEIFEANGYILPIQMDKQDVALETGS